MCGLFGWALEPKAAKKAQNRVRTLHAALAALNDRRGGDSWGYYNPKSGRLVRDTGDAAKMGRKRAEEAAACATLVGHTRKATTGAVTWHNAHPFRIGAVVGAHNGVVFNHQELNKAHGRACSVDSMHLFHHLDEGKDPAEISAYGAVSYCHRDHGAAAFLCRFNGGELSLAEVKGLGFVWSSDDRHLEAAIDLAGLTADLFTLSDGKVLRVTHDGAYYTGDKFEPADPWAHRWAGRASRAATMTATGSSAAADEARYYKGWYDDDDDELWAKYDKKHEPAAAPEPDGAADLERRFASGDELLEDYDTDWDEDNERFEDYEKRLEALYQDAIDKATEAGDTQLYEALEHEFFDKLGEAELRRSELEEKWGTGTSYEQLIEDHKRRERYAPPPLALPPAAAPSHTCPAGIALPAAITGRTVTVERAP